MITVALCVAAGTARAQQVPGGNFYICDDCDNVVAKTLHLRGRAGFGTNIGVFKLVNPATADQDIGHRGYTPGVDFTHLFVSAVEDFRNVANPPQVIAARNLVFSDFLNPLLNGFSRDVGAAVNIPAGTPAGIYRGSFSISDSVLTPGVNPAGQLLRTDNLFIEVEVLEAPAFSLVQADTAARLDSLVIRGRAGQRVSAVARIANVGNTPLTDVQVAISDLRSESAVGLVIPSTRATFAPSSFATIVLGDTARVTVTIDIPRGLLSGRYRGTLFVQAHNAPPIRVPIVLVVTSSRGILFENNPIRSNVTDVARIAFNGDPGTGYRLGIFDMRGIMAYETSGTVYAGQGANPPAPGVGADYAVAVAWPLVNGIGRPVASGMYVVVVESTIGGKRTLSRDKLMVIR